MSGRSLERRFALLSGLRWVPIGLALPFMTLLPLARGLTLAQSGAIWAVHGVALLVLEVPSGTVADTVGRRRTLVVGGLLTAAALAVMAFAQTFLVFALAGAAMGVGRSFISGALEAWFVDARRALDPESVLRGGLASATAMAQAGLGGGALLAGALPLLFDLPARGGNALLLYSPAFLAGAAIALVYALAVVLLVDEAPRERAPERRLREELRETFVHGLGAARRSATVRLVLVVAAAFGVAIATWEVLWQPRLATLVGGAADHTLLFGALSAASMLIGTLGTLGGYRLAARFGTRVAYVAGPLVAAAGLSGLAFAGDVAPFVVAYVVVGVSLGLSEPVHQEFLHEAIEDRVRATVVSLDSLAAQLGGVAANLGATALAGATSLRVAWLAAAGVMALGAVVAARAATTASTTPS